MKTINPSGYFLNILAALVLLIIIPGICLSAVPLKVNYQGYLTSSGVPFDGTLPMTFSVYNDVSGGVALWTETHNSVAVTNGVYSVILGSVDPAGNPLDLPFDTQYYLGVQVDADAEMTPRQQLTSIGYAINADTAEFAYNIADNTVLTSKIADGAITDSKISGTISGAKLGNHNHSAGDINTGVLDQAFIDPAIATDSDVTTEVNAHASRTDNPHSVTSTQVSAAAAIHDHDTRYYTEAEVDALLATRDVSIATLQTQVAELIDRLQHFRRDTDDIYIEGANLHVTNGNVSGSTASFNGLGNIIIGFNELRGNIGDVRTGSHNLVVGSRNSFSKYGGIVVGEENTISAPYASVTGGFQNIAGGTYSSVTGGSGNQALGNSSSISGGFGNTAYDINAHVSGGEYNIAMGMFSSILGGDSNETSSADETIPPISPVLP